ncbi:hypothetical protein [Rhizobium sp. 18055]|uniref:hypothetical protein n=1 Tax=Rhizobium sp. 18055 TaxID=2681403 RepID=UPI00135C6515|nr:hypothetical protein [Rhizobium sp. 18055]
MFDGLAEFLLILAFLVGSAFGAVVAMLVLLVVYCFVWIPLHAALAIVVITSGLTGWIVHLYFARKIS